MKVEVYALSWNEERFLPYFLRHYSSFASRITIFDNESTDDSVRIIERYPNTRVRSYATGGEIYDATWRDYKNEFWKESRGQADWVIIVDVDEIVYHPSLLDYLAACSERGITIPWTNGYEMVADRFPDTSGHVYEQIVNGAHDEWYSKPAVFDPNAIEEINYIPGAHDCSPIGRVLEERSPDLKLLHYRFLGLDYVLDRFERARLRQSPQNLQRGWSHHVQKEPREIRRWFKSVKKSARPVV